jgi:hypothetical protein
MDRRPLGRNLQDLSALRDRARLSTSDKAEEAAQRGETAVTRADGVATLILSMVKQCAHLGGCEIG